MTWLGEQNKGRQIGWESFRCPSSEFRGQFSFGTKRFWSAMRLRIDLKHAVLRRFTTAFLTTDWSHRPMAGLVSLVG